MGEFTNQRIVVMGLGRFGGGIGVTRWLCAQGARVTVTDAAHESVLKSSLARLDGCDVALRLGGHDAADLDGCDLVVASPAVDKRRSPFIRDVLRRDIRLSSEMNLFLERCPARLIGITGSAGKSTTTAMVAAILSRAAATDNWRFGRVWVGGNIGRSLLDDLDAMGTDDIVVLELSSFQLEDAAEIRRSPNIALVTNLRENHLDRHGTLAEYAAAKANIFEFQGAGDCLLLPDDAGAENLPGVGSCVSRVLRFGVDSGARCAIVPAPDGEGRDRVRLDLSLPGAHNLVNAAGALAIARELGVADAISSEALRTFGGLPHRLEFLREHAGIRYYNDSKATSPEAALTSMRAFDRPPVVMLGGSDKGSCYDALGAYVARHAKAAICYGETAPALATAIRSANDGGVADVFLVSTLAEAVAQARGVAGAGDVVLLSPACASYDQFANYEERGDAFREIVCSWE